jgi:hypothetical protein
VALGGDCLADTAVLRDQPDLAGPVAWNPVVSRLVSALAADLPRALQAIRAARAAARERAWALAGDAAPGAGGGLVVVDLDATIVIAHPEKEQAAPTWKKTFGIEHGRRPHRGGPASRWRSCRPGCASGCWSAPTPAAAPASS